VSTSLDGPHLVLRRDARREPIPLDRAQQFSIGRSDDNAVVIDESSVSRKHAVLQLVDGRFHLVDLGSRNGSFVNDRRVTVPVTVRDGDRLRFGQIECEFHWPGQDRPATLIPEGPATYMLQVRQLISVLVVDIRGFTVLTRTFDERMLGQALGAWFSAVGQILNRAGSYVDKYIGDAVMAVWFHGENDVKPGDVKRILDATVAISQMSGQLHTRFSMPSPLRVGAGVNTGYAIVGNTGTVDRQDYTAIGDTVNATFRLESATKEVGADVAIGETTFGYLGTNPTASAFKRVSVALKGYESPVVAYASTFDLLASMPPPVIPDTQAS
jgi:adenylate cyclase